MPEDNITVGELLSDDLKSNESLSKFAAGDVSNLAKSYLELESKQGRMKSELESKLEGMVRLPDDSSDDNARREFFTKLGCPAKPEDYPKIEIDGIPETENDQKVLDIVRKVCHKVGTTASQYKEIMTGIAKEQLVSLENFVRMDEQAEKETIESLTQEWGGEDKFKEKLELAKRLVKKYDSEDSKLQEYLMETRLGSYAPLVKLLGNLASDFLKEDTSTTGRTVGKHGEVEVSPNTGEPMLKYDKSPELR